MDALRFDYRGTGDSAGDAELASLNAWSSDVAAAIEELQAITPSRTVALVGLGVGASLACRVAASNPGIDLVVLWSPVVDGARYLKGLEAHEVQLERTERLRHHWTRAGSRDLLGYALSDGMEEELRSIDLRNLDVPRHVRALLLTTAGERSNAVSVLEPAFERLDVEVIPGPERWLDNMDLGSGESNRGPGFIPVEVIRLVTKWLSEA